MNFVEALEDAASQSNIELNSSQIEAFRYYQELLLVWNEKMNLTAITKPADIAVKHIIDSLMCYDQEVFTNGCSIIDVGTGAGFPGLPLKIFCPDVQLTLLDSLNKRLVFLQEVVDKLGLKNVKIIHARAEDGARNKEFRDKYDVAVSRAVARLNVLTELCLPFVRRGGYFVALKGAQYQEEVDGAVEAIKILGGSIRLVNPVKLPGLDDSRAIIYINKVGPSPNNYPRRPGVPEKNPL
ncbi:MAG: rsmG [Firmicutes bacterium]|nr:rsmG [Bacillota bacterium]